MQTVVLIAFLFNIMTGELGTGVTPITFQNVKECEDFVKEKQPPAPPGMKWYHNCINPSSISI